MVDGNCEFKKKSNKNILEIDCNCIECTTKKEFLQINGWHTYRKPNYWIKPSVIIEEVIQDYRLFGMPLCEAVQVEKSGTKVSRWYPKFITKEEYHKFQ